MWQKQGQTWQCICLCRCLSKFDTFWVDLNQSWLQFSNSYRDGKGIFSVDGLLCATPAAQQLWGKMLKDFTDILNLKKKSVEPSHGRNNTVVQPVYRVISTPYLREMFLKSRETERVMTQNIGRYYLPTRKIWSGEYFLFYNLCVAVETKQIWHLPHPSDSHKSFIAKMTQNRFSTPRKHTETSR